MDPANPMLGKKGRGEMRGDKRAQDTIKEGR